MTLWLVSDGAEYEDGSNADSIWSTVALAQKRSDELTVAGYKPFIDEFRVDARPDTKSVIDYELLPTHLKDGMRRYVEHGIETGSFLRAVLENDLEQAALRADVLCLLHLKSIALFLHSLPPEAWGSRLIVQAWIDKHHADPS